MVFIWTDIHFSTWSVQRWSLFPIFLAVPLSTRLFCTSCPAHDTRWHMLWGGGWGRVGLVCVCEKERVWARGHRTVQCTCWASFIKSTAEYVLIGGMWKAQHTSQVISATIPTRQTAEFSFNCKPALTVSDYVKTKLSIYRKIRGYSG